MVKNILKILLTNKFRGSSQNKEKNIVLKWYKNKKVLILHDKFLYYGTLAYQN